MPNDTFGYFNPIAWPWSNSTSPPPSSLFPTAGANGMAATPSGMLGNSFGAAPTPPALPPTAIPPGPAQPALGPSGPSLSGIIGSWNAASGATGVPNQPDGGIWSRINDGLGAMSNKPGWLNTIQGLQKMLGASGTPQGGGGGGGQAFQPINMARPVGPGAGPTSGSDPVSSSLAALRGALPSNVAGALSPYISSMNPFGQAMAMMAAMPWGIMSRGRQ